MVDDKKLKRQSWLDQFRDDLADQKSVLPDHLVVSNSRMLDDKLYELWCLGRDIILLWSSSDMGMKLLVVPHYIITEVATAELSAKPTTTPPFRQRDIELMLSGSKQVAAERLEQVAKLFNTESVLIELPFQPGQDLDFATIDSLVKRYSISLVEDRAVALFDAVDFSLLSPLQQVTQLNSLAYSVNSAYSKLLEKRVNINFARTTTGDGFYIWNRKNSATANLDLYHFMHLVLADNTIARSKSNGHTVPYLRACFHIGAHYNFYQAEGLSPSAFSYIVGDVTIVLARMIEQALPGQVLFGDFDLPLMSLQSLKKEQTHSIEFIRQAQATIENLEGIRLADDEVEAIHCYLTGPRISETEFGVSRFHLRDKHGRIHQVFNAKINIYRRNAPPIFLGLQNHELDQFRAIAEEEVLHIAADGSNIS